MIRIMRPPASAKAIAALSAGTAKVAKMTASILADPANAGKYGATFKFDSAIYGHTDVKQELIALQHGKCAYCEGKILAFSSGDTEHYRPKGYSKQGAETKPIRPGYYWLAFEWSNLHFACEKCNRAHKGNVFPLRDPATRARSPADDLSLENPMLLDPSGPREPADHMRFKGAVPEARTDVGRDTIEYYWLDRIPLTDLRLDLLEKVDALKKLVKLAAEPGAGANAIKYGAAAEAQLARMILPNAVFSAMTRDYLNPN